MEGKEGGGLNLFIGSCCLLRYLSFSLVWLHTSLFEPSPMRHQQPRLCGSVCVCFCTCRISFKSQFSCTKWKSLMQAHKSVVGYVCFNLCRTKTGSIDFSAHVKIELWQHSARSFNYNATHLSFCLCVCMLFTYLQNPSSDLLHTLHVCCWGPMKVFIDCS